MNELPFEIRTDNASLVLDEARSARTAVTVQNQLSRTIKIQCEIVMPKNSVQNVAGWISIQGNSVFVLKPKETITVPVLVNVPPNQSPSTCRFQLLVYDVNDPEETSEMSEFLSFEAPSPPRETTPSLPLVSKPFPWWKVVVPLAILFCLVVFVALIKSYSKPQSIDEFGIGILPFSVSGPSSENPGKGWDQLMRDLIPESHRFFQKAYLIKQGSHSGEVSDIAKLKWTDKRPKYCLLGPTISKEENRWKVSVSLVSIDDPTARIANVTSEGNNELELMSNLWRELDRPIDAIGLPFVSGVWQSVDEKTIALIVQQDQQVAFRILDASKRPSDGEVAYGQGTIQRNGELSLQFFDRRSDGTTNALEPAKFVLSDDRLMLGNSIRFVRYTKMEPTPNLNTSEFLKASSLLAGKLNYDANLVSVQRRALLGIAADSKDQIKKVKEILRTQVDLSMEMIQLEHRCSRILGGAIPVSKQVREEVSNSLYRLEEVAINQNCPTGEMGAGLLILGNWENSTEMKEWKSLSEVPSMVTSISVRLSAIDSNKLDVEVWGPDVTETYVRQVIKDEFSLDATRRFQWDGKRGSFRFIQTEPDPAKASRLTVQEMFIGYSWRPSGPIAFRIAKPMIIFSETSSKGVLKENKLQK